MTFRSGTIGGPTKFRSNCGEQIIRATDRSRRETNLAPDPKTQAALALHRFGFGPRAGSIAAIASDPRGALLAELDRKGAGLSTAPDLLSSAQASRAVADFNAERQAQDRVERRKREAEQARVQAAASTPDAMAPKA